LEKKDNFLGIKTESFTKIFSFFITVFFVVAFTWIITLFIPHNGITDGSINIGLFSVIPAIFLILYIFITKRILEALILASLMCFVFSDGTNFLAAFNEGLTSVMMNEDTAWLIIVCGLMGSIIRLIEKTGGSFAFGDFVARHSKTRKGALLWTYLLGIIIFIDDYLNSLTVGSCMSPITDKHKVSREELTYIVDSTAAPVCVLLPISTWAVFASRLFVANGLTTEQDALKYFIKTIPFNFYAWIALIIVLLVIFRVIPPIGRMKKADDRVKKGGPLAPANSEKMDIRGGKQEEEINHGKMIDFALPIACLIISTILCDVNMQMGVIITLGFMFFFYVGRGLLSALDFSD
jgi:Na+/H+ antiporter NhaC